MRISCLPIYPDTWFGISLNGKEVKVRSSAFYRPEKDGVLPETPPNSTAGTGGNAGQANKKSSAGNGGASNGSSATTPTSASNGESGNDGGQSPTNGDSLGSYGKSKKRKRNDDRGELGLLLVSFVVSVLQEECHTVAPRDCANGLPR